MKRRGKHQPDWVDDGRTIANMSVTELSNPQREEAAPAQAQEPNGVQKGEILSPRETRQMMLAGMKWAFLFSAGLMLALALFVLFCVKVWFA
jgi:hypothetical protein